MKMGVKNETQGRSGNVDNWKVSEGRKYVQGKLREGEDKRRGKGREEVMK